MFTTCIRGSFIYLNVKHPDGDSYTALVSPHDMELNTDDLKEVSSIITDEAKKIIKVNCKLESFAIKTLGDGLYFTLDTDKVLSYTSGEVILENHAKYVYTAGQLENHAKYVYTAVQLENHAKYVYTAGQLENHAKYVYTAGQAISVEIIDVENILVKYPDGEAIFTRSTDLYEQQIFYTHDENIYYTAVGLHIYSGKLAHNKSALEKYAPVTFRYRNELYAQGRSEPIQLTLNDPTNYLYAYAKDALKATKDPIYVRQIYDRALQYLTDRCYLSCKAALVNMAAEPSILKIDNTIMHIKVLIDGIHYHAVVDKREYNSDIVKIYEYLSSNKLKPSQQIDINIAGGVVSLTNDKRDGYYRFMSGNTAHIRTILNGILINVKSGPVIKYC